MAFDYIFGKKKSKKQRQREQLEENRRKGKAAEDAVRLKYALEGYEVERTGKGSDMRVIRHDLFTGKVTGSKLVEVKAGDAKLSKLQEKTKKKKSDYKVERVDNPYFMV